MQAIKQLIAFLFRSTDALILWFMLRYDPMPLTFFHFISYFCFKFRVLLHAFCFIDLNFCDLCFFFLPVKCHKIPEKCLFSFSLLFLGRKYCVIMIAHSFWKFIPNSYCRNLFRRKIARETSAPNRDSFEIEI